MADLFDLSPDGAAPEAPRPLADRLRPHGEVRANPYLIKFSTPPHELTIFKDGRAIIKGTEDAAVARSLYARYVGH